MPRAGQRPVALPHLQISRRGRPVARAHLHGDLGIDGGRVHVRRRLLDDDLLVYNTTAMHYLCLMPGAASAAWPVLRSACKRACQLVQVCAAHVRAHKGTGGHAA